MKTFHSLWLAVLICACTGQEPAPGSSSSPVRAQAVPEATASASAPLPSGAPIRSPSGRASLVLISKEQVLQGKPYRYFDFRILDSSGRKLFESKEEYAGWFSLWFAWDAQDRVWVGSGDVGISW